jgi:transposase
MSEAFQGAVSNNQSCKSFRPNGKPLTTGEKWIILNIYQRCREEHEQRKLPLSEVYERSAYYAGVSRKVVVEIIAHFRQTGTVPPAAKAGNQINHQTSIPPKASSHIRQLIFDSHREGTICEAKHVGDLLEKEFNLRPHLATIKRHLNRLGFEYKRNKPKTRSLREKDYVRQQRHTYLHQIRQMRRSGHEIIYLDESFLHHHHGQQFSWFDEGDFLERPSGKGKRWCFIHAISQKELLENCLLAFEGKKSTGDYHGSFNFEVFYEWFQEQLMLNLPEKSCIVMDRATYHMVPEERIIPTQMRKLEIQEWLTEHNIFWEEHWLKPKLVDALEQRIDRTPLVQKEAQKYGHQLLILPVHHPELNPIELIWALVKNKCAKKLRNGMSFKDVLANLKEEFGNISEGNCQNVYEHVKKQEEEFWEIDLELDYSDEIEATNSEIMC